NDSIPVRLLQNNPQFSGEENLNHSAENLEYVFADALRVRLQKKIEKVAFLEGHGELMAEDVYDASVALSKYFQVDRGVIGNDASVLDDYKAIIIAGPKAQFNEREKFIIDQYIMNGGRVLWMLDGVRLANDSLATVGMSPAIPLDLNLSDQLFRYGVRVVPAILEDMQCVQVPMNVAKKGEQPQYEAMPFYYSPLLLASPESPVTKNIVEVKANFASGIDLNVSNGEDVKKSVLLATSNATHVEPTPTRIDLSSMYDMDSKTYFNQHYMPVAALLEGTFSSIYTNRMAPDSVTTHRPFMSKSKNTRMIFVANSEIIRNDIVGTQANPQIVPLGYDRYTGREFGNRNFVINSVLYLTDDEGWLQLRSREFKLRLLNKVEIIKNKTFFQVVNVMLPVLLLLAFGVVNVVVRKRKYAK
ncbi:MAG: Gldg family protein, partial [Paludibacteraceae bacterium]|nr:Gldg family protein [Paludibacteraceae bacterium]